MLVKGVQPFSYSFPATATTAAVHAYLVATMAESGMEGCYDLKEGFPPRKLRPSEETLAEAGLAEQAGRSAVVLGLQLLHVMGLRALRAPALF